MKRLQDWLSRAINNVLFFVTENPGGAIFIILTVCCFMGLGVYIYGRNSTYTQQFRVKSMDWVREQQIETYTQLYRDTYQSSMPSDAYDIVLYTTSHYASSTCYTGSGKNRSSYECGHSVTDYMARYHIDRWIYTSSLWTRGTPFDEVVWPRYTDTGNGELGSTRHGPKYETYTVHFTAKDHAPADYSTTDQAEWRTFSIESDYMVSINRLEQIYWDTLKRVQRG